MRQIQVVSNVLQFTFGDVLSDLASLLWLLLKSNIWVNVKGENDFTSVKYSALYLQYIYPYTNLQPVFDGLT